MRLTFAPILALSLTLSSFVVAYPTPTVGYALHARELAERDGDGLHRLLRRMPGQQQPQASKPGSNSRAQGGNQSGGSRITLPPLPSVPNPARGSGLSADGRTLGPSAYYNGDPHGSGPAHFPRLPPVPANAQPGVRPPNAQAAPPGAPQLPPARQAYGYAAGQQQAPPPGNTWGTAPAQGVPPAGRAGGNNFAPQANPAAYQQGQMQPGTSTGWFSVPQDPNVRGSSSAKPKGKGKGNGRSN
ncbi:hypothetical protein K474DRAFT_1500090 [Panus rudis PR-1116 ss-1]|nr:hypothetical protein K474DRAFT_1500090 [Panus rudis PR-1116 ss-1]